MNSTACLPLYQVIDQAYHNQLSCPLIHIEGKIAEIAPPDIGADLWFFRPEYPHKHLIAVKRSIGFFHVFQVLSFTQLGVYGGEDTTAKGNHMGSKCNLYLFTGNDP